jgi:putative membrane protein
MEKELMVAREYPWGCGCLTKAILTLGLYFIWWAAKKLVVTNKSVKWQSGVFNKRERVIPVNRVTDVVVHRGLFGRMLGYGNISIESAGGPGTEIVASGVQKPDAVRDTILSQTS